MSTVPSVHRVGAQDHRLRLDRYVHKVRPDLVRSMIEALLRCGGVQVNGRARDGRHFVKRGDRITLLPQRLAAPQRPEPPAEIARSAHLVAVGKPPGIVTTPSRPGSLLSWVEERFPDRRPGVLHRLDKDTSGVLLFSLSPRGHQAVLQAFRDARVVKIYWALVCGKVRGPGGSIAAPLGRSRSGRVQPVPAGQPARTLYRVRERGAGWTLLEVKPLTGRMHQIRAHLAAQGHPVAGDRRYGQPPSFAPPPRLWLHALSLELPPSAAEQLDMPARISCPLWPDLDEHLGRLKRT